MDTQGRDLLRPPLAARPGPDRFIRGRLHVPCPEWGSGPCAALRPCSGQRRGAGEALRSLRGSRSDGGSGSASASAMAAAQVLEGNSRGSRVAARTGFPLGLSFTAVGLPGGWTERLPGDPVGAGSCGGRGCVLPACAWVPLGLLPRAEPSSGGLWGRHPSSFGGFSPISPPGWASFQKQQGS